MTWIWRAGLAVGATVVAIVLLEGVAGLVHFAWAVKTRSRPVVAERAYTEYDSELGWVSRKGVQIEDFYGPGRALSTNSRGFRGTREVSDLVPEGRIRVVCSGDSFTLGYGVGDRDTWCARLEEIDPRLETVNMGQGGYGIDQAFLWYQRESAQLEHDIQLFGFIHEDFLRMGSDRFAGYGKPVLALRGEELVVENVPVPRAAYLWPWLVRNEALLDESRILAGLRALYRRASDLPVGPRTDNFPRLAGLALAAFERARARNREKGSELVLLYLPTRPDFIPNPRDAWRAWMANETRRREMILIDLVPLLRRLSLKQVADFFIEEGELNYLGAVGHYTEAGNRWVAEQVYQKLKTQKAIAHRLAGRPRGPE